MPIGTLNSAQFNSINRIITLRAQELVSNMVVMEVSGANKGRSGGSAGDAAHVANGTSNFSVTA